VKQEIRRDRANSVEFALRLLEINRPFANTNIAIDKFKKDVSEYAFAIVSFIGYEMDTSDRTRAIDLGLQMTETYNRNFPQKAQGLTTDALFALARNILEFMRYEATPIA
jgi:hypothetical protein